MRTFKTDVIQRAYLDEKFQRRDVLKNRTVYEKKDGSLWINFVFGKRRVHRRNGKIYHAWKMKTIQPLDMGALLNELHRNSVQMSVYIPGEDEDE